jgi:uncharacterized membrane protein
MTEETLTPRQPDAMVRSARAAALAALLAMVLLHLLRELWLAPTGSGTLLVLTLPPLLLCVGGMLRHRMYTFRWLSLLLWVYFALAVIRATTEGGIAQLLATVEVALCLVLFGASVMYIRWRQKNAAREAAARAGAAPGAASAAGTGAAG